MQNTADIHAQNIVWTTNYSLLKSTLKYEPQNCIRIASKNNGILPKQLAIN